MRYPAITEEKKQTILDMLTLHPHMTYRMIASITKVNERTVTKIMRENGFSKRLDVEISRDREDECLNVDAYKKNFLEKNWHWKNPRDKKDQPVITQRTIWKQKCEQSDFRTPYRFPGRITH